MEKSTVISSAVSSKTAAVSLLNNTLTMWCFLIKAPYLGKLSVTYDEENVGLSHFSSDKNKGSQSIAEIRCLVIKPLITDSMASISLVT